MLNITESTCWTLIRKAAQGGHAEQEAFAARYGGIVRSYLSSRWRSSFRLADLDDAVQEVFLDCFRERGVLERADPHFPGGFRGFLYGVSRTVALRFESDRGRCRECEARPDVELEDIPGDAEQPSKAFDRAWALAVLKEALDLQVEDAKKKGDRAFKRVELLRLRTREGRAIRDIARLWDCDPTNLHREYARVRREFKSFLHAVLVSHCVSDKPLTLKELSAMIATET